MNLHELLLKRIRDMMNEGADHLALGGAKNFEDYQRLVGRIEALGLVEREILDLLKNQEEET
jgi:hypothetical protein|tara:strand:- start:741 stop:926 length:186 start_codon:yes stop_codon:yes gene_type:complete